MTIFIVLTVMLMLCITIKSGVDMAIGKKVAKPIPWLLKIVVLVNMVLLCLSVLVGNLYTEAIVIFNVVVLFGLSAVVIEVLFMNRRIKSS